MLLLIRQIIICIFLTLIVSTLAAQNKQVNTWYFGYNKGLDFNTSPPSVISSPMAQLEGSSVISDENGKLLFYTDGLTIWDKQHNKMPNGSGLFGNESSSQSALIVPKPGSSSVFYLFTSPPWGDPQNKGICYSIIDLTLNGGLGDVVPNQKNISLFSPATEKLAAMHHSNGKDIWVVSSKYNTNQYYAYLVTDNGVCDCPVVSEVGQIQRQFQGYLKFSPNGEKLVSAQAVEDVELFNFDTCTGIITYFDKIPKTIDPYPIQSHFYGASFSPDNSKLYLSTGWWGFRGCAKILQYDMNAPNINKSEIEIYNNILSSNPGETYCLSSGVGAMQIGPDNKIYVTNWFYGYLHVINNPNELGSQANFVRDGLYIGGQTGALGLPNFIESYFNTTVTPKTCSSSTFTAEFSYKDTCYSQYTQFINLSDGAKPESAMCYYWDFGDAASGNKNSSNLASPAHMFSAPGTYQVTLKVSSGVTCKSSTITKTVAILPLPEVNLGTDQVLCLGDSVRLDVSLPGATYQWQDQSTKSFFTTKTPGTYWVDVTQGGCSVRDSVKIDFISAPIAKLGNDITLCVGEKLNLNVSQAGVNYRWQDGSQLPAYTVTEPGLYWVEISNGICTLIDSIQVAYQPLPKVELGIDLNLCMGDSIRLDANLPSATYQWQDQSTKPFFTAKQPGIYWVEVTQGGCSVRDSVKINMVSPVINLGRDTILCMGTTLTLNASQHNQNVQYIWQDGTTSSTHLVNKHGIYWVELSNSICKSRDTINIRYDSPAQIDLGEDLILCLGDRHRLSLQSYPDISYRWSNQTSGEDLIVDKAGTYWVEYKTIGTTCLRSDTIKISYKECLDDLKIPNVITPNGDNQNETFILSGAKGTAWNLLIFNRWGVEVARYNNYQNNWNAYRLENAIYYYVLTSQQSGTSFKGWVQVLR